MKERESEKRRAERLSESQESKREEVLYFFDSYFPVCPAGRKGNATQSRKGFAEVLHASNAPTCAERYGAVTTVPPAARYRMRRGDGKPFLPRF